MWDRDPLLAISNTKLKTMLTVIFAMSGLSIAAVMVIGLVLSVRLGVIYETLDRESEDGSYYNQTNYYKD